MQGDKRYRDALPDNQHRRGCASNDARGTAYVALLRAVSLRNVLYLRVARHYTFCRAGDMRGVPRACVACWRSTPLP